MESLRNRATDARQTPQWAQYLRGIGWVTKNIEGTNVFIHKNTPFKSSLVKVSHPTNPIPFAKIEETVKEYNPLFILIEPAIKGYDENEYIKNGYQPSKLRVAFSATLLIDIAPDIETIFKSFSENARRNIKKAQKNNLTIKNIDLNSSEGPAAFEQFFELYRHLGKLKGFYTLPHAETMKREEAFHNNSFLSMAYDETGTPVAAVWYGIFNETLVYMNTGINKKGYEMLANFLLVHEGIKYGKIHGCTVLDFESIYDGRFPRENKKWLGYTEFKKKFHGEIVEYPRAWIKIYSLPYRLLYLCASIFS